MKTEIEMNTFTNDNIYKTMLDNGLKIYVVKREGYLRKMAMFGTIYGSIDNKFVDIETGDETNVPDGIAHFLEHKLFEQEGDNALDIFSKMGANTNAYTSFDHTVYFFDTINDFDECLHKLIQFVSQPYFTNENVEKEKGIIEQEIKMYEDEPNASVYFNLLRTMYKENPINIDIAGTVESIQKIDKEVLYKCYNNFYNIKNMFLIIIGDVDTQDIINQIHKEIELAYNGRSSAEIIRITKEEPKEIVQKKIEKKLSVAVPTVCIGIKTGKKSGIENVKNTVICEIINEIYFSKISSFYKKLYEEGTVYSEIEFGYECGKDFSHVVISAYVINVEKYLKEIKEYLNKLQENEISEELFEIIKNKKKGEMILNTERLNNGYRLVIDSIIQNTDVFEPIKAMENVSIKDIKDFIKNNIKDEYMSVSQILPLHETD